MTAFMTVKPEYYSELARVFSPRVFKDLAVTGSSAFLNYVFEESGFERAPETKLVDLFENIYAFLLRHYRSEYVYKNALVTKILLGRHSLATSSVLTEFPTLSCKADLVILNGSSVAYEIKTELDSLERLQNQIASYRRVFDQVFVVTHESHLGKLSRLLSEEIGLIVLTDRYTLNTVRPSASNKMNASVGDIFDCLRQHEYCEVVKSRFGFVPNVPNTRLYEECRRLFLNLTIDEAHDGMVAVLKRRCKNSTLNPFVSSVPHSLKLISLIGGFTVTQRTSLLAKLQSSYS
jgi:hypothetical protein